MSLAATRTDAPTGTYVFVLVRPRRVQAWREANELPSRVLMEDRVWLYPSGDDAD